MKDCDKKENVFFWQERWKQKTNECKRKKNKQRKTDEVKERANELE